VSHALQPRLLWLRVRPIGRRESRISAFPGYVAPDTGTSARSAQPANSVWSAAARLARKAASAGPRERPSRLGYLEATQMSREMYRL
jgi:hypothetical protein